MSEDGEHERTTDEPTEPSVWLPIREISRLTGVNTVTLRAWERRYGLLKPQRTHKGHRLYSHDDIATVNDIQVWLRRGLAISKVKDLLNKPVATADDLHPVSAWSELQRDFISAISAFDRRRLETLMEKCFALYPMEMIADELLQFLNQSLRTDSAAKRAQRAFYDAVIAERLHFVLFRQRAQAKGESLLLLNGSPGELAVMPLALSLALTTHNYRCDVLHYLDIHQARIAVGSLGSSALVICGYDSLDTSTLLHLTDRWREGSDVPLILVGPIATWYLGHASASSKVIACENQCAVPARINQCLRRS